MVERGAAHRRADRLQLLDRRLFHDVPARPGGGDRDVPVRGEQLVEGTVHAVAEAARAIPHSPHRMRVVGHASRMQGSCENVSSCSRTRANSSEKRAKRGYHRSVRRLASAARSDVPYGLRSSPPYENTSRPSFSVAIAASSAACTASHGSSRMSSHAAARFAK